MGDAADVLERCACALARLGGLVRQPGWSVPAEPVELEHDRRERLTDLVVQLPSHASPLVLLSVERALHAQSAFLLEPLEHRIERDRQAEHVGLSPG